MRIIIEKGKRLLRLMDGGAEALRAPVALGRQPVGAKRRAGDGRTPEGVYRVCLAKEHGKYGLSLALNYPNHGDAARAFAEGAIDRGTLEAVAAAEAEGRRPPWGSPLGGEIYLHEGSVDADWTAGCVALRREDMAVLFAMREGIEAVEIRP